MFDVYIHKNNEATYPKNHSETDLSGDSDYNEFANELPLVSYILQTFYLQLYGVKQMVKDHSDSVRGNPLLPHGLLIPISSKVFLYASSHRQDNIYHSLCYTSCGALAGMGNSSVGSP